MYIADRAVTVWDFYVRFSVFHGDFSSISVLAFRLCSIHSPSELSPVNCIFLLTICGHICWSHPSNKDWLTIGIFLTKIAMWEEDNEFFKSLNENIRWAQKLKYQKAVSVDRNEANIRSVNHCNPNCTFNEIQDLIENLNSREYQLVFQLRYKYKILVTSDLAIIDLKKTLLKLNAIFSIALYAICKLEGNR